MNVRRHFDCHVLQVCSKSEVIHHNKASRGQLYGDETKKAHCCRGDTEQRILVKL